MSPAFRAHRWLSFMLMLGMACWIQPAIPIVRAGSPPVISVWLLSGTNLVAVTDQGITPSTPIPITGITAGEILVDIDVRPQNNRLYSIGVNATTNTATLYMIDPFTGAAGVVETAGTITFTTDGTTVVDLPDPATVGYGIDFNPAADRLRVVAGSLNFRVNPNTGLPIDGNNNSGVTAGTNPDGSINAGTTTVSSTAYTNSSPNTTITTQYTLDATSDSLFIQNLPNAGTQTLGQSITLGGNPLDFTAFGGFDIPASVNAAANNTAVTSGSGFAVFNVGGQVALYSVNLVNAQATQRTIIGSLNVRGMAIWNPTPVANALSADGASLVRFGLETPATATPIAITGITAGETLVGIDGRPATGQLYGLGVDPAADTATLYLIDPQSGGSTAVGATGQIAFVDAGGTPVDFSDPTSSGYGFDFNPSVDRIRVVTGNGLNFRVNPITGSPVDGDLGGSASSVAGINTDAAINGSTNVTAAAYTNTNRPTAFGSMPTTLYTIDSTSDSLYIQNLPNNGTQTNALPVTQAGMPLNMSQTIGFDIPPGPSVAASNGPAKGNGYIVTSVNGSPSVYRVDLTTGLATSLGAAALNLGGLVAWSDTPKVTLASATMINEAVGTAQVTVESIGGGPAIVGYSITNGTATSATDFTAVNGTLVVNQPITQTISIPITDDTAVEENETFTLNVFGADGSTLTRTLTIVDNEPTVQFSAATSSVAEFAGTAVLTVTLSASTTITTSVDFATTDGTATAGSDYTATSGTLSFAPGETSKTISVPITADLVLDAGETFSVTLSNPVSAALGTPAMVQVIITPDQPIYKFYLILVVQ